ncbi:MAG: MaoC family dehydratase [Leptospiraceae bacterium]|nr:MaoC family dehydratase [Leptospiraceae bacterium]
MKEIQFNEINEGMQIPELKVGPITHANLVRYAGASGDFNPIHNDKEFAIANGLDGTIAHGMYVMAQIGRVSTNWIDQKQIKYFGVKFKAMTKLGTTLSCRGVVKKKKEDNGEKLVTLTVEAVDEAGEVKASGDLIIVCK